MTEIKNEGLNRPKYVALRPARHHQQHISHQPAGRDGLRVLSHYRRQCGHEEFHHLHRAIPEEDARHQGMLSDVEHGGQTREEKIIRKDPKDILEKEKRYAGYIFTDLEDTYFFDQLMAQMTQILFRSYYLFNPCNLW